MIKGRCECGRVSYELDGDLVYFSHCHCSRCRKLHGAAFATWGGVLSTDFSYTSGETEVNSYAFSENSVSYFCRHCGSRLLAESRTEPEMVYIAMGTVDGEVSCPAGFHEFVGSKAPWHEISDDLPQYMQSSDDV